MTDETPNPSIRTPADAARLAHKAVNILCKWRSILAGWQLGTRGNDDPECNAVRDHREATLIHRVELNALGGLLIEKKIITAEEFNNAIAKEAVLHEADMQKRFPGFKATEFGMQMDPQVAVQTTKGWKP